MKALLWLLRSIRWILACVGLQFVLFVALAAWKRLAPEGELPKMVIDRFFDVYGPGLDLIGSVLPEGWLARGDAAPPILLLAMVVVAYGIALGLAISLIASLGRHLVGRR